MSCFPKDWSRWVCDPKVATEDACRIEHVISAESFCGYQETSVLAGALRGVGDVIVPVIITLLGICVMRIAWLIGVLKISPTISAIIFSYPVTWLLTALLFIGYYLYKQKKFS